jgi:hypothetical protein
LAAPAGALFLRRREQRERRREIDGEQVVLGFERSVIVAVLT